MEAARALGASDLRVLAAHSAEHSAAADCAGGDRDGEERCWRRRR